MLRRRHLTPVIPTKSTERRQLRFDRELYHERTTVERLINRLKQFRRIATRYEKLAVTFLSPSWRWSPSLLCWSGYKRANIV